MNILSNRVVALKRAVGRFAARQLTFMARICGFLVAGIKWTERVYLSLLIDL